MKKALQSVLVVLVGHLIAAPAHALSITPDLIVLNVQGQQTDIQAIIPMALPAGYGISDFHAVLSFNDTPIAEAFSMRYCYIDENLFADFAWQDVLTNPDVTALAGATVVANVTGWVTVANDQGDTLTRQFVGDDLVEIKDPDWKMAIAASDTPPDSPDLLIVLDTEDAGEDNWLLWEQNQDGETAYGQTFRFAQPVRLDKITLKIRTTDTNIGGRPVELQIGYAVHDPSQSGLTMPIVSLQANLPASLERNSAAWLTFDFRDLYLLTETDYGFLLRFASGPEAKAQRLEAYVGAMGADTYADGTAFVCAAGSNSTLADNELVFYIHGNTLDRSPLLGDANLDYVVDFLDLAVLSEQWLMEESPVCVRADLTCDGAVDPDDLQLLADRWLTSL